MDCSVIDHVVIINCLFRNWSWSPDCRVWSPWISSIPQVRNQIFTKIFQVFSIDRPQTKFGLESYIFLKMHQKSLFDLKTFQNLQSHYLVSLLLLFVSLIIIRFAYYYLFRSFLFISLIIICFAYYY